MSRILISVLCILVSGTCVAGELIKNALIVEVANTSQGGADFAVRLEGGTGVCVGEWIVFPESSKASVASFNQAFAVALAALAAEKKVRIHNFTDNSCSGANFISVIR